MYNPRCALKGGSLALYHIPRQKPSTLPGPGLLCALLVCWACLPNFSVAASTKTWTFPLLLPGRGHAGSHTETLVWLMDCRASGRSHKRHQAILLYSCVGARSPGTPPVRDPEAQQVAGTLGDFGNRPWGTVWDRGLPPAVVNTGDWLQSFSENSPHRKGRGCLQANDAGSHSVWS